MSDAGDRVVMTGEQLARTVTRMAHEILEKNTGDDRLATGLGIPVETEIPGQQVLVAGGKQRKLRVRLFRLRGCRTSQTWSSSIVGPLSAW